MLKITDGRDHLYEWDTNRSLTAIDLPDLHHVDFVKAGYEPMTVVPVDNVVNIPNILLQNSLSIVCFVVSIDDKGSLTTSKQIFRVEARLKPADYVYTETEIYTWDQFAAKQDEKLSEALAAEKAEVERIVSNLRDTKLDKPSTPPTEAGKILKVLSVNEDGTFTCEWADEPKSGGDYFEIKLDWDTMTCNHSASEIREASDTKTFVGPYRHDDVDNYFPDIEKGIATIIEWEPSYHNEVYKYIVNEDKTFEELKDDYRMITGEPIRISVESDNRCTYSASELKGIIQRNRYELVPYIYMINDGLVYSLVNYYMDHAELGDFFRFACLTLNSVIYAEISGESKEVTFTEKFFS